MSLSRSIDLAITTLLVALAACAPAWKKTPHDRLFQYEPPITLVRSPSEQSPSDWWDHGMTSTVRPLGRLLSPGTYISRIAGGRPAGDVNAFGQVPDSTWFENRIGRGKLTSADAFRGAASDEGPAAGELRVIGGKIEGVSAGFVVRDSAKQIWFIKLDHPGFPELSTSAEVVASRLLWLAGYHVPSMHLLDVDRARFVLDPKAKAKDLYNRPIPLTRTTLDVLLANTNPDKTGRVRMLFSRQPAGVVLGSFSYRGIRADDPNDTIEHEHRRSLRGLWLFSAWLNNIDTRDANSLDMFRPIAKDGRGVVDHYLIDFGDSFGATGEGEKVAVESWEYLVDWSAMFRSLFSFGVGEPPYRKVKRSPVRSVGLFEAKLFDPDEWKSGFPNPAFAERTPGDEFWAASILARIQPDHIRAAVTAGRYREEGAQGQIVEVLLARRKKLLQHALLSSLELDRPRVVGKKLRLDDLRVLGELPQVGTITYVVRWNRTGRPDATLGRGELTEAASPEIDIDLTAALARARTGGKAFDEDPFLTVELTRYAGPRLQVHLRASGDELLPVAVDR